MTRRDDYSDRKRFRRNTFDGAIGGVCAGLADYTGWDLLLIRVVTLVLILAGFPFILPVYIALWIFTPAARPVFEDDYRRRGYDGDDRPRGRANFKDVSRKFRDLEKRLQDMEKSVTSGEWKLRRQFRELE